jgi:hypothetical protein
LNLNLEEVQEFQLSGEGDYEVKVSDGENEITHGGVALTGHAVSVKAIKGWSSVVVNTPVAWIFLVIVLGAGILFFFRNALKKKSVAYPWKNKIKRAEEKIKGKFKGKLFHKNQESLNLVKGKENETNVNSNKKGASPVKSLVTPEQAQHVLVLDGKKTSATILALKIKNKLNKSTKESLQIVNSFATQKKAQVWEIKDYIFVVFSPLITRSMKNEVSAVKVGVSISKALRQHNDKFKDKIKFGIGIGSGEIVNKIEAGKLKFTALRGLLGSLKKTADCSEGEVLMTRDAFNRGSSIKADKKIIKNNEVYEVKRVVDAEQNKKFLDGFLKRLDGNK